MGIFDPYESLLGVGRRFSREAKRKLLAIPEIGKFFREIESTCFAIKTLPSVESNAAMRRDLVAVRDPLKKFVEKAKTGNLQAGNFAMSIVEDSKSSDYSKLTAKSRTEISETLLSFLADAELIVGLLTEAIDSVLILRGRRRKKRPLLLAFRILAQFDENNVEATSYESGPYFCVLEIIFEELFPDMGPEAYQRYGRDALKFRQFR